MSRRLVAALEHARTAIVSDMEKLLARGGVPFSVKREAVAAIRPMVIQELLTQYRASGLGIVSGELLAAVQNARVMVTRKNIIVSLPAGKDANFYKKASALQHGRIEGTTKGVKMSRSLKSKLLKAGQGTRRFKFMELSSAAKMRVRARYEAVLKGKGYG